MPPLFEISEICLAEDKNMHYEAKILKIYEYAGRTKYFIHFQGWSPQSDVWVDETSLMKWDKSLIPGGRKRLGIKLKRDSDDAELGASASSSAAEGDADEDAAKKKKAKQLMMSDMCEYDINQSSTK